VREQFVAQCMMAGFPASYFGIEAWSETDLTEDLKRIDVPALVVHGDDDQVVPIDNSARRSSEIIPRATLKVYEGGSHGLPTTHKDRLNNDLLAFIRA
jgi:non-heme chloroperoxidase